MQHFRLLPPHSMEREKKKGKGAVCVKRRQLSEREQREQREGEESERQMDMEVWREALKGAMVPGDEAG